MHDSSSANCVILVTINTEEAAADLAKALVQGRLVACANIIPRVRSIYSWKGDIQDDSEVLIILKTKSALFNDVKAEVRRLHSYETPEIIELRIENGLEEYLGWINESTL